MHVSLCVRESVWEVLMGYDVLYAGSEGARPVCCMCVYIYMYIIYMYAYMHMDSG